MLFAQIDDIVANKAFKDPKSLLQEFVQARKQNSPVYKVLHEEGPPHAKTFTIGAFVNSSQIGEGVGRSKQEAEEQAAQKHLHFSKLRLSRPRSKCYPRAGLRIW